LAARAPVLVWGVPVLAPALVYLSPPFCFFLSSFSCPFCCSFCCSCFP
jgi:hypothetical protein